VLRPVGSPEDPSVVETTGPKNMMPSRALGPAELVSVPCTNPLTWMKVKACALAASVSETPRAPATARSFLVPSTIIENLPGAPAS
jgi:hypothetical protein